MNTCIQTDIWISRIIIVLSLILMVSAGGILTLVTAGQSLPDILIVLECVCKITNSFSHAPSAVLGAGTPRGSPPRTAA